MHISNYPALVNIPTGLDGPLKEKKKNEEVRQAGEREINSWSLLALTGLTFEDN